MQTKKVVSIVDLTRRVVEGMVTIEELRQHGANHSLDPMYEKLFSSYLFKLFDAEVVEYDDDEEGCPDCIKSAAGPVSVAVQCAINQRGATSQTK